MVQRYIHTHCNGVMNILSLVEFIKTREIVLDYPLCHLNHNNFVQNECCKVYGVARFNIFRYFDPILLNTRSSSSPKRAYNNVF